MRISQWPLAAFQVFCCLMLAACAPQVQSEKISKSSPKIEIHHFIASDGAALPLTVWPAEKDKEKASILALHGFNDYSHAFALAGEYLAKQGVSVYAFDQRGFGETAKTGIWAGEKNLTSDVREFVAVLKEKKAGVPIYVMGESMGGAVAITSMTQNPPPDVAGVILVAPAVWGDQSLSGFYRGALWCMTHLCPACRVTGEGLKIQATDNLEILRQMVRDPLIIKKTRTDAIYGLVHLMDAAFVNVANIKVPVLLLYGEKDQVIPKEPIEQVAAKFSGKPDYQVHYYEQGYHMLLRDLERKKPLADIAKWIMQQR